MMRMLLFLGAIVSIAGGCANGNAPPQRWTGTVVRVENPPGQHFSPAHSRDTLTGVYVRLSRFGHPTEVGTVKILVQEIYSPSIHGRIGDAVRFVCSRFILERGDVWLAELREFTIVRRSKREAKADHSRTGGISVAQAH